MNPVQRGVWWLWPAAPPLLLAGPTLLAATLMPDSLYERAWRTPKALDGRVATMLVGVVVMFVVGMLVAALAERDRSDRPGATWPDLDGSAADLLRRVFPALVALTVLGYGVWIAMGVGRGLTLADAQAVLTTQDNRELPVKAKLETLPGITTLTQAAIPAAVVGVLLDAVRPSPAVRWAYRSTIALAAIRGFMLAERLAVVEIVVPVLVLRAAIAGRRARPGGRVLLALAPLFAVGLLLAGFAVSEYSRSWNWYSDRTDRSFVDFASERLLGYYATSHNNGALLLEHGEVVGDIPYHTTSFVWQIPPASQLGADVADEVDDDQRRVLGSFGNPEFNSPGGLASILVDYGLAGGLIFATGLGFVIGVLHLGFLHGRLLGLVLYPVAYTGLLELPRYLYWFQGRATPALAIPVVLALFQATRVRRLARRRALRVAVAGGGL